MSATFASSLSTGAHLQLSKLVGDWEGTAKTWFEPDKLADESPVEGTMRLILGGRFILHEYKGSLSGKPLEGMAIIGYHIALKKYQCAWVDSFHNGTAIMFSEGEKGDPRLSILGGYEVPEIGQHWGWRTEIEIVSESEITITAYNISPGGEASKATETNYKKKQS